MLSLSRQVATLNSSLRNPSTHEWIFTDAKHLTEVYTSDDELLRTLDNISHTILNTGEHNDLPTELDLLGAQYGP